jgi:hypothetical protein
MADSFAGRRWGHRCESRRARNFDCLRGRFLCRRSSVRAMRVRSLASRTASPLPGTLRRPVVPSSCRPAVAPPCLLAVPLPCCAAVPLFRCPALPPSPLCRRPAFLLSRRHAAPVPVAPVPVALSPPRCLAALSPPRRPVARRLLAPVARRFFIALRSRCRPGRGCGCVSAFRRAGCPTEVCRCDAYLMTLDGSLGGVPADAGRRPWHHRMLAGLVSRETSEGGFRFHDPAGARRQNEGVPPGRSVGAETMSAPVIRT